MTDQQNDAALSAVSDPRLLLPVPGLEVASAWQVGPVLFHPADAARRLIDTMQPAPGGPENEVFETWLDARVSALSESAVAEIYASDADDGAVEVVANALVIMRAVQHMRNPMVGMRHQAFGLPGDVPSAVLDYVIFGDELTAGAARSGALAGWTALTLTTKHGQLIPLFASWTRRSCVRSRTGLCCKAGRCSPSAFSVRAGCPTSPTSSC